MALLSDAIQGVAAAKGTALVQSPPQPAQHRMVSKGDDS